MKKILITGKGSYIGTKVEQWLGRYPDKYSVEVIDMETEDWERIDFQGYDVVYHVAGIAHRNDAPDELYEQVNHKLAVKVAKKARAAGVEQFIFMSSGAVYSQSDRRHRMLVVDEHSSFDPATPYGISKMKAEKDIERIKGKMKVVILRPPTVYGPGARGNYNLLRKLALRTPLFPKVNNQRSMIYIDNLCEFVRLTIDSGIEGVFLPQNKEYVNISRMVGLIAKAHGKTIRFTSAFNWLIEILGRHIDIVNKVFGSYIYKRSGLNCFNGKYQILDFEESIRKTEMQ